jgi:hypothetical protein
MKSVKNQVRARIIGVLLSIILLSSCSAFGASGGDEASQFVPDLPVPPAISGPIATDPIAQAAELAQRLDEASNETERLAAWLAVYQSVGIPVIAAGGSAITDTGDDPIGPPFWMIWYFSEEDYLGRGIPLTDAARAIAGLDDGAVASEAGQYLLEDLRAAAVSPDPDVSLFGLFIRERIWRGHPGMDMMDLARTPDALTIDAATAYLMSWPYIRQLIYTAAIADEATSSLHQAKAVPHSRNPAPVAESTTCTEFFHGSSNEVAVLEWAADKVFNGIEVIPQIGTFKGLGKVDGVFDRLFKDAFGEKAELAGKIMARIQDFGKLMTLVNQVSAMELVVVSPEPLIRTRDKSPGEDRPISFRLSFNPEKIKRNKAFDCFLRVAGMVGSYKAPEAEAIAGAVVAVMQGNNMPTKVTIQGNLNPATSSWGGGYEYHTDDNGTFTVQFQGAPQPREIPDSVDGYDETYSVHIRAQPQPVTGSSLLDQFLEGLIKPGIPGLGPILNTAGKFTFDMGEFELPMVDWGYPAYRSDGYMKGILCHDSVSTFTSDDGEILTFYPGAQNRGQYTYSYKDEACTITGQGSYELKLDEAQLFGTITLKGTATRTCQGLGSAQVPPGPPIEVTAYNETPCP